LAVPLIALVYFAVNMSKFALIIGSAILLLTQFVYPVFYIELLGLETTPLWLLTIRNLLLVALLIWANMQLSRKADLANQQVRR
jgi:hypothetical protein